MKQASPSSNPSRMASDILPGCLASSMETRSIYSSFAASASWLLGHTPIASTTVFAECTPVLIPALPDRGEQRDCLICRQPVSTFRKKWEEVFISHKFHQKWSWKVAIQTRSRKIFVLSRKCIAFQLDYQTGDDAE